MSRLDDELKMAFRRQPAPAGFADKVMESIAAQRPVRESREPGRWWRSLFGWFGGNRLLQAAVVAMLLIAIVVVAYRMFAIPPVRQMARGNERVETPPPEGPATRPGLPTDPVRDQRTSNTADSPAVTSRVRVPPRRPEVTHADEAEAAKEQVMLALQIASSTLADAQRSVQEDENYSKSR